MSSPLEVLGLDSDADEAAVERAYRRRVKEVHPDHGGTATEFRAVREAYEALTGEGAGPQGGPEGPGESADRTDRSDAPTDDAPTDRAWSPVEATVEYLNFEVLSDREWGVGDPGLFRRAAAADLAESDYGVFGVGRGETVLAAAERRGHTWPYACRGGACANCAVVVRSGEMQMSVDNVLTDDLLARGVRLSCIGHPTTPELQLLYNVKHLPDLEDLRLPPGPFEGSGD